MDSTVLSLRVVVACDTTPPPPMETLGSLAERLDAEVAPKSSTELAIEQERLSFDVVPPLEIQRDYPLHQDVARLAQAVNVWTDLVADLDSVSSVIYRIERTYLPDWDDDNLRALGRRLLAPELPFSSWEVFGGTGSIVYNDKQGRVWSFNIQPRVHDTTKLYLEASLFISAVPNLATEEVERHLQDVWETSLNFLQEVSGA